MQENKSKPLWQMNKTELVSYINNGHKVLSKYLIRRLDDVKMKAPGFIDAFIEGKWSCTKDVAHEINKVFRIDIDTEVQKRQSPSKEEIAA